MEASTVSLICFCEGNLINDDRNAEYVGGYRKAGDVSKDIGFTEFKDKIQGMMRPSSDGIRFKIKCGVFFNESTLIAIDVDDDESLRYILEHSNPIRAYIIKDQPSSTNMNIQREEPLCSYNVDTHFGGTKFSKDGSDNNCGWKENPIHGKENLSLPHLEERLSPLPADTNSQDSVVSGNMSLLHVDEPLSPVTNDFGEGQAFTDADTFREALSDLAVRTKHEYKAVKTTKFKVIMRCNSAGCNWRIWLNRVGSLPTFKVKKYRNLHTCSGHRCKGDADHRQATIKWIASKIKSDIEENPDMPIREIIIYIRNKFGILISYNKAVKAKAKALRMVPNPFEDSYHLLPELGKELEQSGWVTHLMFDKENGFVYFFWAFRACIHVFRTHLRPILIIDTWPVRSGVLLTAYSVDGEDKRFFVAFGIFKEENEKSWENFLNLLKEFIIPEVHLRLPLVVYTEYNSETTVVSVPRVLPEVHHCFPFRLFSRVFANKFKDDDLSSWLSYSALAYDTYTCDHNLERIKEKNEDAYEWLLTVGKSSWSIAYSGIDGLCFNNPILEIWLKEFWGINIEIRLITELIVGTRDKVARDFINGKKHGAKLTDKLTQCTESDLRLSIKGARKGISVESNGAGRDECQVFVKDESRQFVVNLVNQTCSCGEFQVRGFPCKHAAAVILRNRDLDIYNYCKHWVTANTYRATYAAADMYPFEEPYHLIPGSTKELGSGCVTQLSCSEENNKFVYFFWAFRACIHAFRTSVHPELFIVTTPIRSGVLMNAYSLDANNQKFFVAFGIFEQENEKWWEKFLNLLKEFVIPEVHLHFPWAISTKFDPKTTAVLVPQVFPEVNHHFSLLHFEYVFQKKFKDGKLKGWMQDAARSYKTDACDGYLERIKEKNEDAYEWLLKVGKSRWSNAYWLGKSGMQIPNEISNVRKTFLEDFVDIEMLSISELIVCTRDKVARDFFSRQKDGAEMTDKLIPRCERDLRLAIEKAQEGMTVESNGAVNEHQVYAKHRSEHRQFVVNLINGTCSCGRFQNTGFPCKHAAAVIMMDKDLDIYNHCKRWLTADAYRATYAAAHLYPILPSKRKVGRPRKKKY